MIESFDRPLQRRRKPKGSRIVLNRNDKCLVMYIPPIGMPGDDLTRLRANSFFFFFVSIRGFVLRSMVESSKSGKSGFRILCTSTFFCCIFPIYFETISIPNSRPHLPRNRAGKFPITLVLLCLSSPGKWEN